MKQLTCEMCGSTDLIKNDGVFICQSCGCKYSLEEAKKMMIEGVVRVDNTHMIDNWMNMGLAAAKAGNNKEAYEYFTKVIEVDPKNWRAIYEKGKAGAWQSTLGNLRISEIYQGINTALEIISDLNIDEKLYIDIKNEFAVALFNINNAITDLMDENLSALDDKYFETHWEQMWDTINRHITNVDQLENALGLISENDDELSKSNSIEFKKRICNDLRNACDSIQYWKDYSESSLGYTGLKAKDKKIYIDKFWKLVDEIREIEPDYCTGEYCYPNPFDPGLHMSEECYNYWKKIDEERRTQKLKEVKQKRFEQYWEEHTQEKQKHLKRVTELDSEIAKLKKQFDSFEPRIIEIRSDLSNVSPLDTQINEIKNHQSELIDQKSKLGLFAIKQKKLLVEQIESMQSQINSFQEAIDKRKTEINKDILKRIAVVESERAPIKEIITKLEKEKEDIQDELTRER